MSSLEEKCQFSKFLLNLNVLGRMKFAEKFTKSHKTYPVKLLLYGTIYRPDSFVLILRYCANLKAIKYESMSLNRIIADKSHRVIVA